MKYTHLLSLTFLILLSSSRVHSQTDYQYKKDSLLKVIPSLQGTEKLDAYSQLAYYIYYYEEDTEIAMKHIDEYEREAYKQKDNQNIANAKRSAVILLESRGRYDLAIERMPDDLEFLRENDKFLYYDVYGSYADAFFRLGQKDRGLKEAQNLYEEAKLLGENNGMQAALYTMGNMYAQLERWRDAEEPFRKGLEVSKKLKEITPNMIGCYNGLINMIIILRPDDPEIEDLFNKWEADTKRYGKEQGCPADWNSFYNMKLSYYSYAKKDWGKVEYYCDLVESLGTQGATIADMYLYRIGLLMERKQWEKALGYAQKGYDDGITKGNLQKQFVALQYKAQILNHMGRVDEGNELFGEAFVLKDSLSKVNIHSQLDELRTQYEVDRHIAEKERNRNYFFFALGGCILLIIALGIWIYYNRQITKKNKTLVHQIKELQIQQEIQENEILNKESFIPRDIEDDFCPEKRKDQLCIAIRDIILKEKAYRNPAINREILIDQLGTNKDLFIEAFQYCFNMSFPEFINSLRLKDAISLLEQSDLSIEEISEKVGFGTIRTFQRQFQAKYNMSPKDYRKVIQK
jgi:AraC-like DNA-binding protein